MMARDRGVLFLIWLLPLLGVLWTVAHRPDWREPRQIEITLEPGKDLILGHDRQHRREDLWSPSADPEHILIQRTDQGEWLLGNISDHKRVLYQATGTQEYRWLREWPLQLGGGFTLGTHRFQVTQLSDTAFTLQEGRNRWHYYGVHLQRNDQTLPACGDGRFDTLRDSLPETLVRWLLPQTLHLGGGVHCATRLGLDDMAADGLDIVKTARGFVLRPGPSDGTGKQLVQVGSDFTQLQPLRAQQVRLNQGDRLIVGYTQYQVAGLSPTLTLDITQRGLRWLASQPFPESSPAVQVTLRPVTLGSAIALPILIRVLAIPASLLVALYILFGLSIGLIPRLHHWLQENWRVGAHPLTRASRWRIGACLYLSLVCLLVHHYGNRIPILWIDGLLWLALGAWLWVLPRSPWSVRLLSVVTLLWGMGSIAQLQLGLGATEDVWLRFGVGNASLGGAFAWLFLALFAWLGRAPFQRCSDQAASLLVWTLAIVSLLALIAQAGWGDEGGWGGFQPFELTKLALIIVAASALGLRMNLKGWDLTYSKLALWWRYLGPVVILSALVLFALLFLRDFSPVVLLGVSCLTVVWVYLRQHESALWRWGGQAVLLLAVVAIAVGILQIRAHPHWFPPELQPERIQVWADSSRYPHTGYQLRQAQTAIRTGGWWGTLGDSTENAQPSVNGRVMGVPAIQDDFAPAFFLQRYGGLMGLTLLTLQVLFVLILFAIARRSLVYTQYNDYRLQHWGWFAYFALAGGSGLLAAHLWVSWGTNLGFLPVMGQPMPFISAAGSHLILLVLPLIALAILVEEGQQHAST